MGKQMNVLISAYAVSPNHGSEPGVGWNWVIELSKYCNVHVITEAEFKKEIEVALQNLPQKDNIQFYFNDIGEKARKMCWNQGDWRFYYYYNKWQKKTFQIAIEIINNNSIDVIHQLNMIGYREPGYLWKIKEIPLVWGPVGGLGGIPYSYLSLFKGKECVMRVLKSFINEIQIYQPKIQKAIKNADLILAANSVAKNSLQRFRKDDVILCSEAGTTLINNVNTHCLSENEELIITWIGRNIASKALILALESLLKLKHLNLTLHVIGVDFKDVDFGKKNELTNVIFHPWMAHQDVQQLLNSSNIFLFTSLFEATGTVVLEAIDKGVPVICHDICGQGDVINETCGIKIPAINPKLSIIGFSEAITKLYNNRVLLKSLSDGAIKRASEITWEKKTLQLINLYNSMITIKSNENHI